jgi:hypothetical protein
MQQWNEFKSAMDQFGTLTWKVENLSDSVDFMDLTISIEHTNRRLITKYHHLRHTPPVLLKAQSSA